MHTIATTNTFTLYGNTFSVDFANHTKSSNMICGQNSGVMFNQ